MASSAARNSAESALIPVAEVEEIAEKALPTTVMSASDLLSS